MAFELEVQTKYGVNANYWKISKVEKDYFSSSAFVIIYGFKDQFTREQMKDCLEKRYINVYPNNFDPVFGMEQLSQTGMNDLKSLYIYIKENEPEFKDAIIVDEEPLVVTLPTIEEPITDVPIEETPIDNTTIEVPITEIPTTNTTVIPDSTTNETPTS